MDSRDDEHAGLEVARNYEKALKKIGGAIHASDPQRWVNGFLTIDGKEVWAEAEKGNGKIWLRIVTRREKDQIVIADAASFANGLKMTGHVAAEGIYFDTGSTRLRPESAPALAEIVKLLEDDGALQLIVVGHTATVGNVDSNVNLSSERADAVVRRFSGITESLRRA